MKLFDLLRPECISAGVSLPDKDSALRAVAALAGKSPVLENVDEEEIFRGLKQREELGSTGFGDGIAIPHCRLENVRDFVVGIITVPTGVDFDAMDGKKVKVIVFIVAPARETNEHLRLLSAISHALRIPGSVKELVAEKNSQAVWESFLRYARDKVEPKDHSSKHLIHLFVQDENIFRNLLNEFATSASISVTVLESRNSREYLAKMPLFSGLWSDSYLGFSRLILAVVEKSMTNEIIRRIEGITGSLDECRTAMVAIQDIFYTAGSLEA